MQLNGVYSSLTLGKGSSTLIPTVAVSAGATSCVLTWNKINSATAYDIWSTLLGNSRTYVGRTSGLTYTVTGLTSNSTYSFEVIASNSSGIISTTTTSATTKPLTTNFTYIVPGTTQQFSGNTTSTRTAYWLNGLNVPNNAWTGMRIGFTNDQPTPYAVAGVYMANTGAAAPLTENINTGYVTIFSEHAGNGPLIVSAGSSTHNKVTWFGGGNGTLISQYFNGAVDIVVELSGGAPLGKWVYRSSIGYYPWNIYDTLGVLPSTSNTINTSSSLSQSFGVLPNLVIKFEGLTTPVVTIPMVGDSHIWGYGDGGGINESLGIPARMFSRWAANSTYYMPINLGYVGQTSPDIATRWSNYLADGFDFRTAAIEFGSINDWVNSLPASGWQTNWNSMVAAANNQPVIPILGGVYGSETSANVVDQKTEWSWIASHRPDLCYGITKNVVTSATMTWTTSADVFYDGSHPNTAGYDQWETDAHTQIENFIAAKVSLYG